jgi:hypothetical protein
MYKIDVSDLDIKVLLKELWNNTITASFYTYNPHVQLPEYSEPDKYNRYFDYHCGRPIKTDFTNAREVISIGYDRDAGQGKFLEIVTKLRSR